jgi:hypothetical protein
MSIDRTDYIVYGWKLPFEMKNSKGEKLDLWDDKYLPMIEGHEGEKYVIIRDQMCGDYMVFGIVLGSAGENNGWNFFPIKGLNVFGQMYEVKDKYREVFEVEGEVADPYLFIFTHFN